MKRAIVAIVSTAMLVGCGARGELVKEKILAQIDTLLGEMNVQRKEVERAVNQFRVNLDQFKRGKIEAKVKLQRIQRKCSSLDVQLAKADETLRRLRDRLQGESLRGDGAFEFSGQPLSPAELTAMVDRTLAARLSLATEAETLKGVRSRLEQVIATMEKQELVQVKRLRVLRTSLEEIDAKAVALKSIQDIERLTPTSSVQDFAEVEKQVDSLSDRIEAELRFAHLQFEASESSSHEEIDAISIRSSSQADRLDEIEAILAGN